MQRIEKSIGNGSRGNTLDEDQTQNVANRAVRSQRRILAVLCAASSAMCAANVFGADTSASFSNSATDLSVGTNYTPNITPTNAGTIDVTLTGPYATSTLDTNGAALVFGSLNDLDFSPTLTVTNNSTTASTITLSDASGNSVAPSSSDLLYLRSYATGYITNGAGNLGLILGASGNFDVDSYSNLYVSSTISAGSSIGLVKTGSGTLILGGPNTYAGGTNISSGNIRLASSSVGTPGTIGSNGALTSGPLGTGTFALTGQYETLDLNGQTIGNRFVISANNNSIGNSSSSLATLSGAQDGGLNGGVISDFSIGSNNGNILVTGLMSRTMYGSFGFTKNNSDTVTFNGTGANVGVGSTADYVKITGGTLVAAMIYNNNGGFADSVQVNGGTLQFNTAIGTDSGGNAWGGQINANLSVSSGTVDLNGSSGQNSRTQQVYGTGGIITNSNSGSLGVIGVSARNNNVYVYSGTVQDGAGSLGVDLNASGTSGSGRINEFTGANTYSGPTTISYGCFELGNALAAQNSVLTVNAANNVGTSGTTEWTGSGSGGSGTSTITAVTTAYPLAFAGSIGTFTIGGLSGAGNIALTDLGYNSSFSAVTAGTVALQIGSSNANNLSPAAYTGVISDGTVAGGSIVKIGSSTETFSSSNSYTGGTTIQNGTLVMGNASALGTGTITLGATTGSNNAAISNNLGNQTISNNIIAAAGNTGVETIVNTAGGGSTTTYPGAITLNHDLTLSSTLVGSGGNIKLTGAITGSRNLLVNNQGGVGAVQIQPTVANTTFTGNVYITNNSTLNTNSNALGTSNVLYIDSGSQINSSTQSLTVAGLNNGTTGTGGAVVISYGTGQTLTIGGSGLYSFAGVISNGGNVTVSGGATQTLSGTNTYTGNTNVNGGTLTVDATTNTGAGITGSGAVLINSTGKLRLLTVAGGSGNAGGTVNLLKSTAALTVAAGGLIDLEFNGSVQPVGSFKVGTTTEGPGYYGSSMFFTDTGLTPADPGSETYFTGDGGISVPEPTLAGTLVVMGGASMLRRRRRVAR